VRAIFFNPIARDCPSRNKSSPFFCGFIYFGAPNSTTEFNRGEAAILSNRMNLSKKEAI
jgi:hypothetical protein